MQEGRIDLSEAESERIDALEQEYGRGNLSRRDPGEKGPVLYKLRDGRMWEVTDTTIEQVRNKRDG